MSWLLGLLFSRPRLVAGAGIITLILFLWGIAQCRDHAEFRRELSQNTIQNEALVNEGQKRARAFEDIEKGRRDDAEPLTEKEAAREFEKPAEAPADGISEAQKEESQKRLREKLLKQFRRGLQ